MHPADLLVLDGALQVLQHILWWGGGPVAFSSGEKPSGKSPVAANACLHDATLVL